LRRFAQVLSVEFLFYLSREAFSVKKFRLVPLLLMLLALPCTAAAQETAKDAKQFINDYLVADPSTMDVTLRSDTYSSSVMRNVMEGLVRLEEKDGQYNLVPSGSTGWETSSDGLVWTFHLRPSKWQDGVLSRRSSMYTESDVRPIRKPVRPTASSLSR
jgi:ABC-type oligopeptide transport system substrate-binding subunit